MTCGIYIIYAIMVSDKQKQKLIDANLGTLMGTIRFLQKSLVVTLKKSIAESLSKFGILSSKQLSLSRGVLTIA